jgi:hypothetical protein
MPQCIFCDRAVPNRFTENTERSLCLDCLVELKRLELQNAGRLMERVFPPRVVDALKRLRQADPAQMGDPVKQAQMRQDLQTVQEVLPY